jgi:signal peptidase
LILNQLGNGRKIALRVSGKSMYPLIRKGDPIHIEKCDPNTLSTGDIITFRKDDIYVTHRMLCVVKKGDTIKLITKGDNETTTDRPISPDQILGKVVALERTGRTIHFGSTSWRFINRLFGMIFLMETFFIVFYRFATSKVAPMRTFLHSAFAPSHLYRHFKTRGLSLAMRIIT